MNLLHLLLLDALQPWRDHVILHTHLIPNVIHAHRYLHQYQMAHINQTFIIHRYDVVTLLFSGIVGFAQYCAANTDAEGAMKIVKMLNELYTIFDALSDAKRIPNVYKVSQ